MCELACSPAPFQQSATSLLLPQLEHFSFLFMFFPHSNLPAQFALIFTCPTSPSGRLVLVKKKRITRKAPIAWKRRLVACMVAASLARALSRGLTGSCCGGRMSQSTKCPYRGVHRSARRGQAPDDSLPLQESQRRPATRVCHAARHGVDKGGPAHRYHVQGSDRCRRLKVRVEKEGLSREAVDADARGPAGRLALSLDRHCQACTVQPF